MKILFRQTQVLMKDLNLLLKFLCPALDDPPAKKKALS